MHLAVAPVCFDQACQGDADRTFLIAIAIPIVVAVVSVAYLLRPLPEDAANREEIFSDPETGIVFEGPEGTSPERDQKGELVWKAISYTPWPVSEGTDGEKIQIEVGPVKAREKRSYLFEKIVKGPSELIAVSLPRPLGIVFAEGRDKTVVVGDLLQGGAAEQKKKVAQIDRSLLKSAIIEGDVLRAITCTNFVYPTQALFGVVPPERHIVLFGADGQSWPKVTNALRKGDKEDGDVTVVVERRIIDE
ncbi:hypothetical protein BSKO_01435 [Bryopsis sp. KO-2023]|nr:hypothetical protein BSKO_01435 [Bryopsis sp. KO-2023]